MLARAIQHETDHLDGVLFVDRLDAEARERGAVGARARPSGRASGLPARRLAAAGAGREGEPPLRLLFAGTPAPAVPSLEALLGVRPRGRRRADPARRAGRPRPHGRAAPRWPSGPTPPASRCCSRGRPASRSSWTQLRDLAVDCAPVVAYGALVPQAALDLPRHGWVNLHFSLLPAWRGAAPVQHAIMAGDEITGASTFLLEAGLDTGPVFGVVTEPIGPRDTAGDLLGRLAVSGAGLLVATLDGIADGSLVRRAAAGRGRSASRRGSSPPMPGSTGRCRRYVVDRRVRGVTPAPGAWTTWRGERLRLGPVEPLPERRPGRRPAS